MIWIILPNYPMNIINVLKNVTGRRLLLMIRVNYELHVKLSLDFINQISIIGTSQNSKKHK